MTELNELYSGKPEVLLGDLRAGICSSGLCRQLRAVAADEIERLTRERDEARNASVPGSAAAFDRLTKDRDLWKERHDRECAAHAKNLGEQQKVEAERDRMRSALELIAGANGTECAMPRGVAAQALRPSDSISPTQEPK